MKKRVEEALTIAISMRDHYRDIRQLRPTNSTMMCAEERVAVLSQLIADEIRMPEWRKAKKALDQCRKLRAQGEFSSDGGFALIDSLVFLMIYLDGEFS